MKNQKGVTLATVILTVIVIVIISATSILVGSNLIYEAKEHKKKENYNIVVDAVNKEIAKASIGGVISPRINDFIGLNNPSIGRNLDGTPKYAGDDWYLLDESSLQKLGISDLNSNYLVNYKKNIVIDVQEHEDLAAAIADAES